MTASAGCSWLIAPLSLTPHHTDQSILIDLRTKDEHACRLHRLYARSILSYDEVAFLSLAIGPIVSEQGFYVYNSMTTTSLPFLLKFSDYIIFFDTLDSTEYDLLVSPPHCRVRYILSLM